MLDEYEIDALLAEFPDVEIEPLQVPLHTVDQRRKPKLRRLACADSAHSMPHLPLTSSNLVVHKSFHARQEQLDQTQELKRQRQRLYEKRYREKRRRSTKEMKWQLEQLEVQLRQMIDQKQGVFVVPVPPPLPLQQSVSQQRERRQKLCALLEAIYETNLLQQELTFWLQLQQASEDLRLQHSKQAAGDSQSSELLVQSRAIEEFIQNHLRAKHFSF